MWSLAILTGAVSAVFLQTFPDYRIGPAECPLRADLAADLAADHEYRSDPAAKVDAGARIRAPSTILLERPVGAFGDESAPPGAPFIGLAYDLRERRLRIAGAPELVDLNPADCADTAPAEELPNN